MPARWMDVWTEFGHCTYFFICLNFLILSILFLMFLNRTYSMLLLWQFFSKLEFQSGSVKTFCVDKNKESKNGGLFEVLKHTAGCRHMMQL